MTARITRGGVVAALATLWFWTTAPNASACFTASCTDVDLDDGDAVLRVDGSFASPLAAAGTDVADYQWRLVSLCVISDETTGFCSPSDFRQCPAVSGRVIRHLVLERQAIVRPDGSAVGDFSPPPEARPGDPVGPWIEEAEGCIDITQLNPPPSPAEVFNYFERLPLPELAAKHQPPGDGLSGLPVIFYTDEPTTETFTVDIRGFDVVIDAGATSFTWNTGDPADPAIVTDHPGAAYPDHTITHEYASGTYTASLTVTWGATFTVDGSAPAAVPGTTTTEGPPVTFDVLEARPVLVDPN
jgi:hypothetical protein